MNETIQHNKTLGQRDIVLFSVSAILLLDTLAAGAIGGPSVIFWWLFFGLVFFVPNALMTAELGCTFPEQGGIYAWVRDAFGPRWAARVTWAYWVNMAVWLPAIYILFAGIFSQLFMPDMSLTWQMGIAIALSWITVGVKSEDAFKSVVVLLVCLVKIVPTWQVWTPVLHALCVLVGL